MHVLENPENDGMGKHMKNLKKMKNVKNELTQYFVLTCLKLELVSLLPAITLSKHLIDNDI